MQIYLDKMRKKIVRTSNPEIYNKFKYLNLFNSTLLENTTEKQLNKILKNINSNGNILVSEKIGDRFIIKKLAPLNFEIYLSR